MRTGTPTSCSSSSRKSSTEDEGGPASYESVDEMQADLDAYIETYNRNRPHRSRGMDGRTPYQVFKKGIREPRSQKKSANREVKTAA